MRPLGGVWSTSFWRNSSTKLGTLNIEKHAWEHEHNTRVTTVYNRPDWGGAVLTVCTYSLDIDAAHVEDHVCA